MESGSTTRMIKFYYKRELYLKGSLIKLEEISIISLIYLMIKIMSLKLGLSDKKGTSVQKAPNSSPYKNKTMLCKINKY